MDIFDQVLQAQVDTFNAAFGAPSEEEGVALTREMIQEAVEALKREPKVVTPRQRTLERLIIRMQLQRN